MALAGSEDLWRLVWPDDLEPTSRNSTKKRREAAGCCDFPALRSSDRTHSRRMRKRASTPIRRVVPVVVIPVISGVIAVSPTTTGDPVTLGIALEVPLLLGAGMGGIGAGTAMPGVIVVGSALYAAVVVSMGLVFRARKRPKRPRRVGVVKVLTTMGAGTVLPTIGAGIPVAGAAATGGSAVAVAANRKPIAAAINNRFTLLPPETC
jgi:hypothetical protein